MRRILFLSFLAAALIAFVLPLPSLAVEVEVSLRGSPNSMERQHHVANQLGYEFVHASAEVDSLVHEGILVPLKGNAHYAVNDGVSYPFARPEVRLFIERLAEQYHEGTGERLVVTSLMRPMSEQPSNSHRLSVHPTGIAIDLRISSNHRARTWLESVLLKLEGRRLLDITRERWPPHYHVALFTDAYRGYLEEVIGTEAVAEALRFEEKEPEPVVQVASLKSAPKAPKVAATAVVDGDDEHWMLVLAAVPLALMLISTLTFLQRSREDTR